MADVNKSADKCASAKFGTDKSGVFALLSCDAWLDASAIHHPAMGITRGDTWVRPDSGSKVEMIQTIGSNCKALCENCPKFTPPEKTKQHVDPSGYPSDPEYTLQEYTLQL